MNETIEALEQGVEDNRRAIADLDFTISTFPDLEPRIQELEDEVEGLGQYGKFTGKRTP